MPKRGTIRNTGRVARELAEARQQSEDPETPPAPTHAEYAEEAEAAQRAEAWPQAAALWRRARDVVRATNATEMEDVTGHKGDSEVMRNRRPLVVTGFPQNAVCGNGNLRFGAYNG